MLRRLPTLVFFPLALCLSLLASFVVFVLFALADSYVRTYLPGTDVIIGMGSTVLAFAATLMLLFSRRYATSSDQTAGQTLQEPGFTSAKLVAPHNERLDVRRSLPDAVPLTGDDGLDDLLLSSERPLAGRNLGNAEMRDETIRIIDWGFFVYALVMVPIMVMLASNGVVILCGLIALYVYVLELMGVVIAGETVTYSVRLVIWGPYAFPVWRRSIDLAHVREATAETEYNRSRRNNPFPRIRLLYLTGSSQQARIWFSNKGRRDWLFAELRRTAPHVRQYRGR